MNELIIEVNSKNKTGFGFRAYTETYNQMEIMDKIKTALKNDKKQRNKIIDECIKMVNKQLSELMKKGIPKDLEEFLDGARSNMELTIQDLQALKGGQVDLLVIPQLISKYEKLLDEISEGIPQFEAMGITPKAQLQKGKQVILIEVLDDLKKLSE